MTTVSAEALRQAGADEVVPSLVGYDVPALLGRLEARAADQSPSRRATESYR